MVDFLYNMDIYDRNMEYTSKIRIMMTVEILRHQYHKKSDKITTTKPITR